MSSHPDTHERCDNPSGVLDARCARYAGHRGPHMDFMSDGTWGQRWVNEADPSPIDAVDEWWDWTWARERAAG